MDFGGFPMNGHMISDFMGEGFLWDWKGDPKRWPSELSRKPQPKWTVPVTKEGFPTGISYPLGHLNWVSSRAQNLTKTHLSGPPKVIAYWKGLGRVSNPKGTYNTMPQF